MRVMDDRLIKYGQEYSRFQSTSVTSYKSIKRLGEGGTQALDSKILP